MQKPSRKQDDSQVWWARSSFKRATDSPQINVLGKSRSTKKRQERKHQATKANVKRRSSAAMMLSADNGSPTERQCECRDCQC